MLDPLPLPHSGLIGIIDIGSNSVRMVVFDGYTLVHDEKEQCMLGRDLLKTGRLSEKAVKSARKAIRKFVKQAAAMNVQTLLPIGTAALREASDGRDFIAALARDIGINVRLISGPEEARLSAQGVIHSIPEAKGIVADLGGGSLELAYVEKGDVGKALSLPLGTLILPDYGARLENILNMNFEVLPEEFKRGLPLYAVGGTFRAIARVHMAINGHSGPLQGYSMATGQIGRICTLIRETPPASLTRLYGVPAKRSKTIAPAADLLEALLRHTGTGQMIISTAGLRDGVLSEIYCA